MGRLYQIKRRLCARGDFTGHVAIERRAGAGVEERVVPGAARAERAHLRLRPERTTGHPRSLAMDGTKLQRNGIAFSDTVDGFLLALSEYGILPLLKE